MTCYRRLETRDDFDDDATGNLGDDNGLSVGRAGVPTLLVAKQKKAKVRFTCFTAQHLIVMCPISLLGIN